MSSRQREFTLAVGDAQEDEDEGGGDGGGLESEEEEMDSQEDAINNNSNDDNPFTNETNCVVEPELRPSSETVVLTEPTELVVEEEVVTENVAFEIEMVSANEEVVVNEVVAEEELVLAPEETLMDNENQSEESTTQEQQQQESSVLKAVENGGDSPVSEPAATQQQQQADLDLSESSQFEEKCSLEEKTPYICNNGRSITITSVPYEQLLQQDKNGSIDVKMAPETPPVASESKSSVIFMTTVDTKVPPTKTITGGDENTNTKVLNPSVSSSSSAPSSLGINKKKFGKFRILLDNEQNHLSNGDNTATTNNINSATFQTQQLVSQESSNDCPPVASEDSCSVDSKSEPFVPPTLQLAQQGQGSSSGEKEKSPTPSPASRKSSGATRRTAANRSATRRRATKKNRTAKATAARRNKRLQQQANKQQKAEIVSPTPSLPPPVAAPLPLPSTSAPSTPSSSIDFPLDLQDENGNRRRSSRIKYLEVKKEQERAEKAKVEPDDQSADEGPNKNLDEKKVDVGMSKNNDMDTKETKENVSSSGGGDSQGISKSGKEKEKKERNHRSSKHKEEKEKTRKKRSRKKKNNAHIIDDESSEDGQGGGNSSKRESSGRLSGISPVDQMDNTSKSSTDCFAAPLPPSQLNALKSASSSSSLSTSNQTGKNPTSDSDESPKPEKVKSRWRRNSELESVVHSSDMTASFINSASTKSLESFSGSLSNSAVTYSSPSLAEANIVIPKETEPLPVFGQIDENMYLFERKKSKSKKEVRRMVCDCILTKEERTRGIVGCGDDCLNRMLMIECGSRCPLGDHCANKRFQKKSYAKVDPFKTSKKGWGLRALQTLQPGAFIMEYVGEVVEPREFKCRVEKYAKEDREHHYFMALKSDEIIDATEKGNVTRFINHSCEPNAETQKWTVNGELRIGFFAKNCIQRGEEITFDYQFQRYGKKAQKCYCETQSCRGYIGANNVPSIDTDGSLITTKARAANVANKVNEFAEFAEAKTSVEEEEFEDLALEDEIEKLTLSGGLRNRQQTLMLARLMVRAEDSVNRQKLLQVIKGTPEVAYLRLLLDYHGLQLLWSWMFELEDPWLKAEILEVLEILPIPNKTMLKDSKVLDIVEKWSKQQQQPQSTITTEQPQLESQINSSLQPQQQNSVQSKTAQPPTAAPTSTPATTLTSVTEEESASLVDKDGSEASPVNEDGGEKTEEAKGEGIGFIKKEEDEAEEESIANTCTPVSVKTPEAVEKEDENRKEEPVQITEEPMEVSTLGSSSEVLESPPGQQLGEEKDLIESQTEKVTTETQADLVDHDVQIKEESTLDEIKETKEEVSSLEPIPGLLSNLEPVSVPVAQKAEELQEVQEKETPQTETVTAVPQPALVPACNPREPIGKEQQLSSSSSASEPVKPVPNVIAIAIRLLNLWKDLKEVFRIPRLERQKRHEDEKEADRRTKELEERRAKGLPIVYDKTGKRGIDDRDCTIAGILGLLKRKGTKRQSDDRRNVQNSTGSGLSPMGTMPSIGANAGEPVGSGPTPPKVNKDQHRIQFEMELMRKQYEEAMKAYQKQMVQYHAMVQQQIHQQGPQPQQQIPPPPMPNHFMNGGYDGVMTPHQSPISHPPPRPPVMPPGMQQPPHHPPPHMHPAHQPSPAHSQTPNPNIPPPMGQLQGPPPHHIAPGPPSTPGATPNITPTGTPLPTAQNSQSTPHFYPYDNAHPQYPPPPPFVQRPLPPHTPDFYQNSPVHVHPNPYSGEDYSELYHHHHHPLSQSSDEYGQSSFRPTTLLSMVSNLIECTNSNHVLMPDSRAVIQTDYGVEYVPVEKPSLTRTLFDPVYPPPGTYYLEPDQSSILFVPPPFDRHGHQMTKLVFEISEIPHSTSFTKTVVQTALPQHWRMAKDKDGNIYYYHQITKRVQWNLPEPLVAGSDCEPKDKVKPIKEDEPMDMECKPASAESVIVSSADSTSTPKDEETIVRPDNEENSSGPTNNIVNAATPPFSFPEAETNGSLSLTPDATSNTTAVFECTGTSLNSLPGSSGQDFEPDPRKRKLLAITNNVIESNAFNHNNQSQSQESYFKNGLNSDESSVVNNRYHTPTESRMERRIKEKFKGEMSEWIKHCLNPYRKLECKIGRILNNEDFKYLARKLTHFVMVKESKHCKCIEDLACNETVKHKAKDYVRKYMAKQGPIYKNTDILGTSEDGRMEMMQDSGYSLVQQAAIESL